MMSSPMNCLHCNAEVSLSEAASGWCESCGKQLPSWVQAEGKRSGEFKAASLNKGSAPLRLHLGQMLWGSLLFLILFAVAVVIILANQGLIVLSFFG